jgi:hypothetical protein
MSGDLDNPNYIRRAGREHVSGRPNVAALCAGVSASQLELFVSLVAHPAGLGTPVPLRFILAPHHLEHVDASVLPYCETELRTSAGDARIDLLRAHGPWTTDKGDGLSPRRRRVHDWLDAHVERFLSK